MKLINHRLILAHMDVHSNVFIHNFDKNINDSYMILILYLQCGRFSIKTTCWMILIRNPKSEVNLRR